jgi:hypothetical protein
VWWLTAAAAAAAAVTAVAAVAAAVVTAAAAVGNGGGVGARDLQVSSPVRPLLVVGWWCGGVVATRRIWGISSLKKT